MNLKHSNKFFLLLIAIVMVTVSCSSNNSESEAPKLLVSETEVSFEPEGGTLEIAISTNDTWKITNSAAWLQLNPTMGNAGEGVIALTLAINETGVTRSVILNVTSDNGQARRITVSQGAHLYPSYNVAPLAPDATGMGSNAVVIASKMTLGWNIGNTFEAPGGETGWGSPVITEDFIKFVKQQGFNTIRIPCAWDWHHVADPATARIDPDWLNRVKEVVGYCVDNDVYALLNIHWDGGWLDANINKKMQDSVNAKQKAYWEQIATAMRDFDDHLLFAGSNEPPAHDAEEMEVLLSYHQTFVDAVRSTGGRNSYRTLVVQGPSTDIDNTYNLMNTLPTDEIPGRMMVEVHYYTPFQFCLMDGDASWGSMFYYWGEGNHSIIEPGRKATWGEEDAVDEYFGKMKTKFVDKGFPVIMGEYGAYRRDNSQNVPQDLEAHNNSVDHWITYVTRQALANGMIPYWWDTGGALDRSNNTVKDQRTIDALITVVAN
ncbi:cellulase family glycosylhydrolase [Confluentibacter flavum]|uniref:Dihydroxy-acid dehydratase n=1 Tax=Confluentibacter flavum TaxID=1909700 RepID=A0A2N3HNU7_9FLAO|nr:cellulase family glycosylhydrolase [Confluentibacter flavum]PKQ46653.1 hypothetical protein CSW08_02400 [Confluentibacter flavum]